MEILAIIELIARAIICGLLPIGVIIACLVLVCKRDKRCTLDSDRLEDAWKVVCVKSIYIILLWILSYLAMNGYYYTQITETIRDLINDNTNNVIQWIVKIIPITLIVTSIVYHLILKITIYPDLAFRIVPGQNRRTKGKRFYQFETQFWNSSVVPHHNLELTLMKWIRTKEGNLKGQNIPMHTSGKDEYIENFTHTQDERAYNWSSCEDKWEENGHLPIFEYLELTVKSKARISKTYSLELSESRKFYPLDIHQGDFKDMSNTKKVPQPLVTSYNNEIYVSAKRKIQQWDEGLRLIQCILLAAFIILLIVSACYVDEALTLSYRIVFSLFLFSTIWRMFLNIPIKARETSSYIYGEQKK